MRFKYIPLIRVWTLTHKTVVFAVDWVEKPRVCGETLTACIKAFRVCCTEELWRMKA